MKKILSRTVLCLLLFVLSGCVVGGKPSITAFLTVSDIEEIEIFRGGVPSQTYRKIVTEQEDIERIINALNALTIVREADSNDYIAGGIGITFNFPLQNEHRLVVKNHGNLITQISGWIGDSPKVIHYIVDGTSLDTDEFWHSFNYEAVRISENELPITD